MPYQAITRAELRLRLTELWEGKPFWVDDEANRAINEALREWNLLTGRWKRPIDLATTIDTYEYGLPESILYQMRVSWNGLSLSPSSREDLNNGRPRWRQEHTASGEDVPARPSVWAPVSLRVLYIWPADHTGNNRLTIDGVANTPVLVADGDFVDLAEADISTLLGYALHVASLKKGGTFFGATFHYFRAFLAAAGQENSLITTSQGYRRFMGLDHRDEKPFLSAPSSVATALAKSIPAEG